MRPIKITIFGDYYDCQIYRGRLYLWTFDGDILTFDWPAIVNSFAKLTKDIIGLKLSFLKSNFLYNNLLKEIFEDFEFKTLLSNKFNDLNKYKFELQENEIEPFLIKKQSNPTNTLPTDTEIYDNKLFYIDENGLFSSSLNFKKNTGNPVNKRFTKYWDCNLYSITANKYPQIALSGGDEGLFELNLLSGLNVYKNDSIKEVDNKIYQISENHSTFSNYSFLSIYNSSEINQSFMAMFKWNKETSEKEFFEQIEESKIFDSNNNYLSWGVGDKIYKPTNEGLEIIKFNNKNVNEPFKHLNDSKFESWQGDIIHGGSSFFGNILEFKNSLKIIQSDGESFTIDGPITKWRVYPRSKNFENHLHVILDDKIEIYAFNHDYFINQNEKLYGTAFFENKYFTPNFH